jgi:hypothetical protein
LDRISPPFQELVLSEVEGRGLGVVLRGWF